MLEPQGPFDYDLLVIGSGPAGQRAAIEAARHGLAVGVVEKQQTVGGVCLHTGTMPSKALREAALSVTGYRSRRVMPAPAPGERVSLSELLAHVDRVIAKELKVIEGHFGRQGIALHYGSARLTGPTSVAVSTPGAEVELRARNLLIATGTVAARPPEIPFDDTTIIDSDQVFELRELPDRMAIVGGGVIALEYASIFGLLGLEVHVFNRHPTLLGFLDRDLVVALEAGLAERGVRVRNGATVVAYDRTASGREVVVEGGERVPVDLVLVAAGRVGTAAELDVGAAGIEATRGGLVRVDERFRTSAPTVLAAGDMIGFPSLAAASRVQGRKAVRHLLGLPVEDDDGGCLPFGIYTVPEISYVGPTEAEVAASGTPYVKGVARFDDVARGEIIGDETGLMKLLFHAEDRKLLAVHVIGTDAAEIVHMGQAVMAFGGTLDFFIASVLNYPTLGECYKIAALEAEARLCAGEVEGCRL